MKSLKESWKDKKSRLLVYSVAVFLVILLYFGIMDKYVDLERERGIGTLIDLLGDFYIIYLSLGAGVLVFVARLFSHNESDSLYLLIFRLLMIASYYANLKIMFILFGDLSVYLEISTEASVVTFFAMLLILILNCLSIKITFSKST